MTDDEALPGWAHARYWRFPWIQNKTTSAIEARDAKDLWVAYARGSEWFVHRHHADDHQRHSCYNADIGPFPDKNAALAALKMVAL